LYNSKGIYKGFNHLFFLPPPPLLLLLLRACCAALQVHRGEGGGSDVHLCARDLPGSRCRCSSVSGELIKAPPPR